MTAAPTARPAQDDRHSSESFELVLSKAKGAYEELSPRGYPRGGNHQQGQSGTPQPSVPDAQSKIADLTSQLTALRKRTSGDYDSLKKITDAQTASMEQIKRLLLAKRGNPAFLFLSVSSPVWALMKVPQRLFLPRCGISIGFPQTE